MQRKPGPLFCERLCFSVFLCPCTFAAVAKRSIPKNEAVWDTSGGRLKPRKFTIKMEYPKKGSSVGYFRRHRKPYKFAVKTSIGYKIYNQKKYPKKGC